tara:strand:+ start:298891 stop:299385 length:495 start_codon:yes stop_codon:yes gene_type:complete
MAKSNVRDIESLESLRVALLKLGTDWDPIVQSIRTTVQRADEYFSQDRVGYWRGQIQIAERKLNEAKDQLFQKRSAARASDRPPATEAVQRVHQSEKRLRLCQDKHHQARAIALEMSRHCDNLLGPLADVREHCESVLPEAAEQLKQLIIHLRRYAERGDGKSG